MSRKGPTELIIGASRAKSHKEAAGGIQKFTPLQNHDTNPPQRNFQDKKSGGGNPGVQK